MNTPAKIQYPRLNFTIFGGRIVEGNPHTPSDIGYQGKKREKPEYYLAVAVDKRDPLQPKILQDIVNHAWNSSAQLPAALQRIQAGPIGTPPPFAGAKAPYAWKISDGDWPHLREKEGFAGCWIYRLSTSLPIPCFNAQNGNIDPKGIKCGDYVSVGANCVINGVQDDQAGVHINPSHVRLEHAGPVINPGPTAEQVFGAGPAPTPVGGYLAPAAMPGAGGVGAPTPAYNPPAAYSPPAPAPTAAPPPAALTPEQESARIAAQHGQQHYPGHRYNPASNSYVPDPAGNAAPAPVALAPVTAAPAPSAGLPTYPATASPISPPPTPGASNAAPAPGYSGPVPTGYAPTSPGVASPSSVPAGYPPVAPHPGFGTPQR